MRVLAILLLISAFPTAEAYDSPAIPGFVDEMVAKHGFRREELVLLFDRAQYKQAVIDAISAPFTLKPWVDFRANFINDQRISAGLQFWKRNAAALRRAEETYGVPQEIIVALLGVETFYGKQTGNYRVLDALSTLAFNYPPRADYFRSELVQYLLLAREQQYDLLAIKGSFAGAIGWPQFMPGSYRKYAVDFNGNGKVDLMNEPEDAIGSVANYLKQYGWEHGEPLAVRARINGAACAGEVRTPRTLAEWAASGITPERALANGRASRLISFSLKDGDEFWLAFGNFDVIMTYNNSSFYAMTVYQLAEALRTARDHNLLR
jgi:membrane-bound lytic murein transglycosylase B